MRPPQPIAPAAILWDFAQVRSFCTVRFPLSLMCSPQEGERGMVLR